MGATVILTARDEERLNKTLSQMYGAGHSIIAGDLSNDLDLNRLVNESPLLDGLVNCAGFTKTAIFPYINKESLESIMNVNFMAPTLLSAQLVKKKKFTKKGSIVFISSISGVYVCGGGSSMYSASKGAVNGIAKNMALELAMKGIRVNCVNPGMVDTHIMEEGTISLEQLEEDKKRYPLKRYGKPEEIAYAVIYLLSDASSWVTGSNLIIDGGYVLL
ncbi:3-oxoacyl-ACP reductase [Spirochaetia bacterium]|nr:3-oxoacyl-ACP reductase [Spirochaetia bacterium]